MKMRARSKYSLCSNVSRQQVSYGLPCWPLEVVCVQFGQEYR